MRPLILSSIVCLQSISTLKVTSFIPSLALVVSKHRVGGELHVLKNAPRIYSIVYTVAQFKKLFGLVGRVCNSVNVDSLHSDTACILDSLCFGVGLR